MPRLSSHGCQALSLAGFVALAAACGPVPVGPPDGGAPGPQLDAGQGPDAGAPGDDAGTSSEPPQTVIDSAPTGATSSTVATFTFSSPDPAATFQCRLDGAAFAPCESPWTLSGLLDGSHLFRVRAVAGPLTDLTPATAVWVVDTLPPQTVVTSGPYDAVRSQDATFTFEASEPNSTFECALDGAAFTACTSPVAFASLAEGAHTFEVRGTDPLGQADPTPALREWLIDPAAESRIRIVAANLTSGNLQSYDPGHGARILQALQPDVVLIQEFNYGDDQPATISAFVEATFGAGYHWHREPGGKQIPNGVISRFPIAEAGAWDDPEVSNREFAWARIDLPGPLDLWAVSVHLLTSSASVRQTEAAALEQAVRAFVPQDAYLVIGGDFNSDTRGEACFSTLSSVTVTAGPYPVDQSGNGDTNASRSKPYDWVLPDADLDAHSVPVEVGGSTFPTGLVFDTRVFTPLSQVPPAQEGDSDAPSMQHMAVVREFVVPN